MRPTLNQSGKILLRLSVYLGLLTMVALYTGSIRAQAIYAGYMKHNGLWAGGEFSGFAPSFPYQYGQHVYGVGLTADYRWGFHWDFDGTARWLSLNSYAQTSERTLLIGPRYYIVRYHGIEPYGKFLVGDGTIHYPYSIGTDSYFTLAPAGGVNLRILERLHVHAEYEYQIWHNAPGFTNEPNHPLRPNGINIGVTYRVMPFKSE
jgi:Outer membrane protein beta-barrel domain